MGRADQTTKIRGMFVHPEQIDRVVKRHPEITRARLVVDSAGGKDTAVFLCTAQGGDLRAEAVADTIQTEIKLRAEVRIVASEEIPNDGKVIEDARSYD
jgi:phenylacetate-CoA ligase